MAIKKIQIIPPDGGYVDKLYPETSAEQVIASNGKTVEVILNELFQSANNGKTAIRTALSNKGVTVSLEDTFTLLASKITAQMCKFGGTSVATDVLSGKTFINSTGNLVTGSMTNRGAVVGAIASQSGTYTIPNGYHSGSGKVTANITNLTAANVVKGVNVGGVVGTYAGSVIAGINWTVSTTNISTSTVVALIYNNGRFIEYLYDGKIGQSYDGLNWTLIGNLPFTRPWDCIYELGIYVVVGDKGNIATSPDGITWTSRTSGVTDGASIISITYGRGIFVAATSNGYVLTSPNGITWTKRTTPLISESTYILSLTYAKGIFIAGAQNYGKLMTSTDGITWTFRTSGFNTDSFTSIDSITLANGYFIAVGYRGNASISPDGITWTTINTGFEKNSSYGTMRKVIYAQGMAIIVGAKVRIATCNDSLYQTWIHRSSNVGNYATLSQLAYGNGIFAASTDSTLTVSKNIYN